MMRDFCCCVGGAHIVAPEKFVRTVRDVEDAVPYILAEGFIKQGYGKSRALILVFAFADEGEHHAAHEAGGDAACCRA